MVFSLSRDTPDEIWHRTALSLGWTFSSAYNGYIHPHRPRPGADPSLYSSYPSDVAAEDACFIDGIETLAMAVSHLEREYD